MVRNLSILALASFVLVCVLVSAGATDKVILKTGAVYEGKVTKHDETEVVLEIPGKGALTFPRADVKDVEFEKPIEFEGAEKAFSSKDYEKAAGLFKSVVGKLPGSSWAIQSQLRLGECYNYLARWEEARGAFGAAVKLKLQGSEKMQAELGLAVASLNAGSAAEAEPVLRKLGDILYEKRVDEVGRSVGGQAQYWLGRLLYDKKQYEEALMAHLKVVVLCRGVEPWVARAMLGSGDAYQAMGDSKRAKSTYEEVVKKYPGTEEAKQAGEMLAKAGGA